MSGIIDTSKVKMWGHVLIRDIDSNEILLDKYNSIHYENVSIVICKALSNRPDGHIFSMVFGNGGSIVSGTGTVTYFQTNTTGMNSTLYNQTYRKVIDDQSLSNTDPDSNNMQVRHVTNTLYSDVIVKCTLGYDEPSGQDAFDNADVLSSAFVFNEIGLKAWDTNDDNGLLLSHIIFNPIQKSLNRRIEIIYTLRIEMA